MKYFELELGEETIKFRLKSSDCLAIEKKTGVKILDFIQDYSMTAIILMLTYLRRGEKDNFSEKEATELYDKLVDSGYTMEKIMFDIIFESLVISGFLDKSQLDEMRTTKNEVADKKKAELKKVLAE